MGSVLTGVTYAVKDNNDTIYLTVKNLPIHKARTQISIDGIILTSPAKDPASGATIMPDAGKKYQQNFKLPLGTNAQLRGKKLVVYTTKVRFGVQGGTPVATSTVEIRLEGGKAPTSYPPLDADIPVGSPTVFLAEITLI